MYHSVNFYGIKHLAQFVQFLHIWVSIGANIPVRRVCHQEHNFLWAPALFENITNKLNKNFGLCSFESVDRRKPSHSAGSIPWVRTISIDMLRGLLLICRTYVKGAIGDYLNPTKLVVLCKRFI